jgi:hypothetical protein
MFLLVLHFNLSSIVEVEITKLVVRVPIDQREIQGMDDEAALLGQASDRRRVVRVDVNVALNADIHLMRVEIPVFESKGKEAV